MSYGLWEGNWIALREILGFGWSIQPLMHLAGYWQSLKVEQSVYFSLFLNFMGSAGYGSRKIAIPNMSFKVWLHYWRMLSYPVLGVCEIGIKVSPSALFQSNNLDILIILESHAIPQPNMKMVFLISSHNIYCRCYYQKNSAEHKSNFCV